MYIYIYVYQNICSYIYTYGESEALGKRLKPRVRRTPARNQSDVPPPIVTYLPAATVRGPPWIQGRGLS